MALAETIAPFLWGAGGSKKTPEQVAREREIAAALMQGGMDYSPVDHWLQGAARASQGLVGGLKDTWANEAEQEGIASARNKFGPQIAALLGGGSMPGSPSIPTTAVGAATDMGTGDFLDSLVASESGGNWNALNDEGYGGRLQFGDARLADAAAAGIIPAGVTGADFSMMPPEVQQAVEQWHFADIDQQAANMGLNQYFGQTIAGVPITPESVKAMAHLGGIGGVQKFIASGGQYNPADSNGTRLSDYGARFGGAAGSPGASASPAAGALIAEALSDPWAMQTYGPVVEALFGQQMQQQDPRYQQQLRQGDLDFQRSSWEFDQARNAPPPLPGAPKTERMFDPETGREQVMQWDAQQGTWVPLGGVEAESGPLVNINNLPETAVNDFFSNLGAQETANYKTILENGPKAARTLAQLDQLDGLLAASPQGFEAAATAFAGNFGIDLGNASGVQAAQALINQLVPAQRPPGSGPMSDADLELFKQSVPRIINQPGGNQIIMDTMRQINLYDQALANIVQESTWRGEMAASPEEKMQIRREMRDQIAALQNPLEQFGKRIEGYERPTGEQGGTGTTSTGLKWSIVP